MTQHKISQNVVFFVLTAGNKQQQMNEPPAPAPPPRPYDSLLPQLAVSGLTWNGKTEKPEGDQVSEPMAQQNRSGADVVWKEEQEEDEDLDSETGQQKEEVPVIVSGNDENLSGEEPSVEVSSSGNEELMQGRNHDSVLKTSGENLENDDKNTVDQDTASSGSGEADESENHHVAMYNSPESGQEEEEGVRQVFPENEISGSGQVSTQEIDDSDASSPENGQDDYVGQGSPKSSISRSGQFKKQESDDIESSLSGSGQYEEGETFSGSGE